jgi:hypothetical protein
MENPLNAELINRGDGVAKVRELLSIPGDPPPYDGAGGGFKYQFPESGIWIFFDENLCVRTLRFDSPFPGKIGGIRIGDLKKTVRQVRGKPDRKWPVDDGIDRWLYDRGGYVRYDFDPETDAVKTIYK